LLDQRGERARLFQNQAPRIARRVASGWFQ
jgi:hypothetical protein